MRRHTWAMAAMVLVGLVGSATTARANPSQDEVFKSISNNVDHGSSISGTAVVAIAAVAVGIVLLAVVINARQNRDGGAWSTGGGEAAAVGPGPRRAGGPVNHPGKLVRELMRETGLTRARVRQLEAANDRLAADDRGVEHLATLLLCPSLLAASRGEGVGR